MTKEDRDIQRKLKVLRYAEQTSHVAKTCRYFGVGRSSFYRWKAADEQRGEAGLVNAKPIPKNPANQTPLEIVDKVLYLRSKYHLGSIRIVGYLARYHGITISDAGVTRVLRRNGVGRLPRGTRMRKVHTKRYNKQVPGHHIQMDVKFLTFAGKRGEKIRRFQYTAIDVATRFRALEVTTFTPKPMRSTLSITSSRSSRSALRKSEPTTSYVGKQRQVLARRSLCANKRRRSMHSEPDGFHRSDQQEFYQLLSYKGDVDLEPSSASGRTSTTSIDHTAPSMAKPPMKPSANGYNLKLSMSRKIVDLTDRRLERRCFSIGHELGHFLIPTHLPRPREPFECSLADFHHVDTCELNRRKRVEAEARKFAAHLLMPPAG